MKIFLQKAAIRSLTVRVFAKRAPIVGAIVASEDVLRKLGAAGSDFLSGHGAGAKNELQQAATHAIGSVANLLGGVSVIGMAAGMVVQAIAQTHAETIAARKPPHPDAAAVASAAAATASHPMPESPVKQAHRRKKPAPAADISIPASAAPARKLKKQD